ncbi:MAG: hypothetical protein Q9166_005781 [cf. Caloplaca sp. 2 TL-2023]
MDSGWSKASRLSNNEKAHRKQPSQGRLARSVVEDRTTSAALVAQEDDHLCGASSFPQSQSPPRNAKSRSTSEGESTLTASPMDKPNAVPQPSDHEPQKGRYPGGMPEVGLAVVGVPSSGKSTFIQHALDLKKPPTSAVSTKKVSLEGIVSLLRIHEFNIHDVDITPDGTPQWPRLKGMDASSQIDGTMIVYSISDAGSIKSISTLLREFGFPLMLIFFPQVSSASNGYGEQALTSLTLKVLGRPNRPRASTDMNHTDSTEIYRVSGTRKEHQRAQSDFPDKPNSSDRDLFSKQNDATEGEFDGAGSNEGARSPLQDINGVPGPGSQEPTSSDSLQPDQALRQSSRNSLDITDVDTWDGSGLAWRHDGEQKHALDQGTEQILKSDHIDILADCRKEAGADFDELVDRLLSQAISKTDVRFAAIFLCLYRKFAAPSTLLAAIISRFEGVDAGIKAQTIRTTTQLRYLSVLVQWVSEYPGDVAHPLTQSKLVDFLSGLAAQRAFSVIVKEITQYLDAVSEDDDTRLRQLNNYNSLGAVVAGINGTAVHRLYQTRELVPHHVQKQFMRLEILMSTQKSHFAYRLAWSNTSTERIPFLPLHSRDLASAEEGNPTYIGEGVKRINWKKFEVIGDVVVSIQQSQATPYSGIPRNEEVQRLILESKFTKDEDELHDRSIHLEGLGAGETARRKFHWFPRG